MDDYINVLYIDLLNKSLNRCIIDWKCFSERIVGESNKNKLRIALIQYCRGQREIFLKLKVIFDLVKYQKRIDELLQNINKYNEYMDNRIQDLSKNVCTINTNILPSPNVNLAVDLLNTYTYSRIPMMISELSKSSHNNTIPILNFDSETFDLCLNRIKLHFHVLFKLSKYNEKCEIYFDNNMCNYVNKGIFEVQILYDFNNYKIVRLNLPVFVNQSRENNLVLMNVINYQINSNNDPANNKELSPNTLNSKRLNPYLEEDNLFDLIYYLINNFIGKYIMKFIYKQVIEYSNVKYVVFNYKYLSDLYKEGHKGYTHDETTKYSQHVEEDKFDLKKKLYKELNDEELKLVDKLMNDKNEGEQFSKELDELLFVYCYNKYKFREFVGVKLIFTKLLNGNVNVCVDQINVKFSNVYTYNLNYWLKMLTYKMYLHQLNVIKNVLKTDSLKFDVINFVDKFEKSELDSKENNLVKKEGLGEDILDENDVKNFENYLYNNFKLYINKFNNLIYLNDKNEVNLNEIYFVLKLIKIDEMMNKEFENMMNFDLSETNLKGSLVTIFSCESCDSLKDLSVGKMEDVEMNKSAKDEVEGLDVSFQVPNMDLVDESNVLNVLLKENKFIVNISQNNNVHMMVLYDISKNNDFVNLSNLVMDIKGIMDGNVQKDDEYSGSVLGGLLGSSKNGLRGSGKNLREVKVLEKKETKETNLKGKLVLNVMLHDHLIVGNNLLILDNLNNLVGIVKLKNLYKCKKSSHKSNDNYSENLNKLLNSLEITLNKVLTLKFLFNKQNLTKFEYFFHTEPIKEEESQVYNFVNENILLKFDKNGKLNEVKMDEKFYKIREGEGKGTRGSGRSDLYTQMYDIYTTKTI